MEINEEVKIPASGYLYVVLAAVLWAVSGSAAKYLFHQGVTSFQLVQLRLVVSVAVLTIWLGLKQPHLLKIRTQDIPYFLLLGGGAMAAVQFTYLFTISKIHVAAAILLQYLAPTLIAIYAAVFARERMTKRTVIAVSGATIGCYLVVGAYQLNILSMNKIGIVSGLCSAVSFAWYSVQGEYGMRKYDPWTVLFYAVLFAALSWNIFYPPMSAFMRPYSWVEWGWILYIGLLGTALPFGFYFKGISLIRATRASITATLEPITAGLLSYLFLNEVMAPLQMLGGGLVIFSIILLQLRREHDANTPDQLRAKQVSG